MPEHLDTNADKLARRLIAAAPGRGQTPADFAIAIDDLEPASIDQPGVVLD